jgi:prepilin-type N-terminal cleavage/methylation domain-containing protein
MKTLRSNKGFTLVELAIVLVIIGIILGAVLKGQELINNAKIKRLYNQYREVLAAVYTYYDKYGKYPGDDPNAATRWSTATPPPASGNNDGLIGGFTESCQAWYHMRLANILTGTNTQAPSNPYGGSVGIGYATVRDLTTMWIGFNNVPGDVCQSLDQMYDDGVYNTGSIRASGDYTNNPNGVYDLYFRL